MSNPGATPAAIATPKAAAQPTYGEALHLSLLFLEAQRSGRLGKGANNTSAIAKNNATLPWRGDSGLLDRAPDGRDLSGGYYDTGDMSSKTSLPLAWSASVLAWSVLEFKEGYISAGQYAAALSSIRWSADYFLKCVGDGTSVVAQVGGSSWGGGGGGGSGSQQCELLVLCVSELF